MRIVAAVTVGLALVSAKIPSPGAPPFLPIGVFLGAIEEGARIFTPVRLLPYEHPEALGHDFPTVQQLHRGELDLLVALGRAAGLELGATLERYPTPPDTAWPYPGFAPAPAEAFRSAAVVRHQATEAPLPGLRVVAVLGRAPVGFLVDTRGLSLTARGMTRPTAMGLDLSRTAFLRALAQVAQTVPTGGATVVVYQPEPTR